MEEISDLERVLSDPLAFHQAQFRGKISSSCEHVNSSLSEVILPLIMGTDIIQKIPTLSPKYRNYQSRPLMKYRGIVQDIFDMEFYSGIKRISSSDSDKSRLYSAKYQDKYDYPQESDDISYDEDLILERLPVFCMPIPGESEWVQDFYSHNGADYNPFNFTKSLKRSAESCESSTEKKRATEEPDLSFPPPSEPATSSTQQTTHSSLRTSIDTDRALFSEHSRRSAANRGVVLKLYDELACDGSNADRTVGLGDVVEVLGVYSQPAPFECMDALGLDWESQNETADEFNGNGYDHCYGGSYNGCSNGNNGSYAHSSASESMQLQQGISGGSLGGVLSGGSKSNARYRRSAYSPILHCFLLRRVHASFPLIRSVYLSRQCTLDEDCAATVDALATSLPINSPAVTMEVARETVELSDWFADDPVTRPCPPDTEATRIGPFYMRGTQLSANSFRAPRSQQLFSHPTLSMTASDVAASRARVVTLLARALGGDELVAEFVSLALLARVYSRPASGNFNLSGAQLLGALPLNVYGFSDPNVDRRIEELFRAVTQLVPSCVHVPISLATLQDSCAPITSFRDETTGELVPSPLLCAPGTVLLLDETAVTAGSLNDRGRSSLCTLDTLVANQELRMEFAYCSIALPTDLPVIVCSRVAPLVGKDAIRIRLTPSHRPSVPQETAPSGQQVYTETELWELRMWWAACRLCEPVMTEEVAALAERDFVAARQSDDRVTVSSFYVWLALVRLVACSFGQQQISVQHWERMRSLENKRLDSLGSDVLRRTLADSLDDSGIFSRQMGASSPNSVLSIRP